jgi:hypothetical protein
MLTLKVVDRIMVGQTKDYKVVDRISVGQTKDYKVVDHISLGQTKDYKIGSCCFSTKHATLRRKSKLVG